MSIVLEDVSKIYTHYDINPVGVKNINLEIEKNEFLCIIGPSGCGKSTLLNLIAGFIQCDSGNILLDHKISRNPGIDRAVVSQQDSVFPWMTVSQNIAYGPRLRKIPKKEYTNILKKYLALVGLEEVSDSFPKDLSGGMKQRVQLARAYANQPNILLLDEPFSSLDPFTKEMMQKQLLQLWKNELKTVIFVTHDIEEALFLSDRIVLMDTRPGSILEVFPVPFPRPRTDKLQLSQEFLYLRYNIKNKIQTVCHS